MISKEIQKKLSTSLLLTFKMIESIKKTKESGYRVNVILSGDDKFRNEMLKGFDEEFSQITDKKDFLLEENNEKHLILNLENKKRKDFQDCLIVDSLTINFVLSQTPENGKGPSYFGLFPIQSSLKLIYNNVPKEIITQKTPLHVTSYFHGGRLFDCDLELNKDILSKLGNIFEVKVLGIVKNKAGYALRVDCGSNPGNHITLGTNEGFKPVDVGTSEDIEFLSKEFMIECLFIPYY